MSAPSIMTIVGARPQFIKAAALSRVIQSTGQLREYIVHTGQHFDDNMSEIFFRELSIPVPWRHLGIGGGGHGAMTGRMLIGLEELVKSDRPDAILVYGDTNSTLAGAITAAKMQIPLIHVEAGLRSFNRAMPEEINRLIADQLSSLLFCPTEASVTNLRNEGNGAQIETVGDINFDATLFAMQQSRSRSEIVETLELSGKRFALCTLHRAENTDDLDRLNKIVQFIEHQAKELNVILPLHPRTRAVFKANHIVPKGVRVIDPLGYFDIHALMAGCDIVITDSGGMQKEAYFHARPCITLRDETEWVETIQAGWNRLWTEDDWSAPRRTIHDYGDGKAANKIVNHIVDFLGNCRS
ncbi:non-hydrolyzing UDP-N-acetylglucosamine 2-epimerase [Aquidulcibacter sp.]|uniref:non-hydrolyzing UDP-N-acetylglucosamine 2-epimerase n=1 Tax=Aquidulcibacter sp. TaxID=2052990 RepID=UPI003BAA46E8